MNLFRGYIYTLIRLLLYTLILKFNLKLNFKFKPLKPLLNFKPQYTQRYNNIEIDWKERIAKYNNRINLKTAIDDNLVEYIEIKIYLYIWHNFIDFLL